MKTRLFALLTIGFLASATLVSAQVLLDPLTQTKYQYALPAPAKLFGNYHEIAMTEFSQFLGLHDPVTAAPLMTTVWGYNGTYPGPTIEAVKGVPIQVRWINNLPMTHLLASAIDTTLHWADPDGPGVPVAVHLHGGEVESASDGGPNSWFTQTGETGPGWVKYVLDYVNEQQAATIWYHDHALGITRLNVYSGLAGFYLLRNPAVEGPLNLPTGDYEREIVIQDRMFTADGSLHFPHVGINPEHPQWLPEFFGDHIVVNGVIWPYLNVEPRKYRFRLLNGSNARFYTLRLWDMINNVPGPAFYQIGTDGGYLAAPVLLNDPANPNSPSLTIAPGERADIIVDFTNIATGTEFIMKNSAKAPFPKGTPPSPQTAGQIMKFVVVPLTAPDNSSLPSSLNVIPTLGPPSVTRTLVLVEQMGPGGPLAMFLDGKPLDADASELPVVGSTEVWQIVNLTADTHPIHIHLVQFQLLNRQMFNFSRYNKAWTMANPVIPTENPVTIAIDPYLQGMSWLPDANERGWKDTFRMNPKEVTRAIIRFAPNDGSPAYQFDATEGPGYVWHCHIIDHEDNEMMRPYMLVSPPEPKIFAGGEIPEEFTLSQNFPNPFNAATAFSYSLPQAGQVDLTVYNVLGQQVAKLFGGIQPAGEHKLVWNAGDFPSGVYFARLQSEGSTQNIRMVLLK